MLSQITTLKNRRTYHTNIKILAQLDLLPPEIKKNIPRSNLSKWKNTDLSYIIGIDFYQEHIETVKELMRYKYFIKLFKAVFHIKNTLLHIYRRKNHKTGIRALKPKEIIHADLTIYRPLDNTKVYISIIMDNFSRFIFGWKASLKPTAQLCLDNLKQVYNNYFNPIHPDKPVELIVDGGSENNNESVNTFISDIDGLKKLIAMHREVQVQSEAGCRKRCPRKILSFPIVWLKQLIKF